MKQTLWSVPIWPRMLLDCRAALASGTLALSLACGEPVTPPAAMADANASETSVEAVDNSGDAPGQSGTDVPPAFSTPPSSSLDLTVQALDIFRTPPSAMYGADSAPMAGRVVVVAGKAYVLSPTRGLQVIDATGAAPALVAEVALSGQGRWLAAVPGGVLAVVQHNTGMAKPPGPLAMAPEIEVVRFQIDASPKLTALARLPGALVRAKVNGGRLTVVSQLGDTGDATGCGGTATSWLPAPGHPGPWKGCPGAPKQGPPQTQVTSLDLANPATLTQLGSVAVAGSAQAVAIAPTQVLVATRDAYVPPNSAEQVTLGLAQVVLNASGIPALGAVWQADGKSEYEKAGCFQQVVAHDGGAIALVCPAKGETYTMTVRLAKPTPLGWQLPAVWTLAGALTFAWPIGEQFLLQSFLVPTPLNKAWVGLRMDALGLDGKPGGAALNAKASFVKEMPQVIALDQHRALVLTYEPPEPGGIWRVIDLANQATPVWLGALPTKVPPKASQIWPAVVDATTVVMAADEVARATGAEPLSLRTVTVTAAGELAPGAPFASILPPGPGSTAVAVAGKLLRVTSTGAESIALGPPVPAKASGPLTLTDWVGDVATVGDRLVALAGSGTDGTWSLRVLPPGGADVRKPSASLPSWGGLAAWLAAVGARAAVVTGYAVQLFDLADPLAPKEVGMWPDAALPHPLNGYANTPYTGVVADGALWVFGVKQALNPAAAGCTANCPEKFTYSGRVAAVDLVGSKAPVAVGAVDLPGVRFLHRPQVVGKLLYLHTHTSAPSNAYVQGIDIANPASPKALPPVNIPGFLVGVAPDGKSAVTLMAGSPAGHALQAVLLNGPNATLASTLPLGALAGPAERVGDRIYVGTWPMDGAGSWQLRVVDAANPAQLALVATLDIGAPVQSLTHTGTKLLVGLGGDRGVTVLDLPAAGPPVWQATALGMTGLQARRSYGVVGGKLAVPGGWRGVVAP